MKFAFLIVAFAFSFNARADVISCEQGGFGTPVPADFISGPESTSEFQGCYLKLVRKGSTRDIGENVKNFELFDLMSVSVQRGKTVCVYVPVNPDRKHEVVNCTRTAR